MVEVREDPSSGHFQPHWARALDFDASDMSWDGLHEPADAGDDRPKRSGWTASSCPSCSLPTAATSGRRSFPTTARSPAALSSGGAIETDASGNLYFGVSFTQELDLDFDGVPEHTATSGGGSAGRDTAIVATTADGALLWSRQVTGSDLDLVTAGVALDPYRIVYAGGLFESVGSRSLR